MAFNISFSHTDGGVRSIDLDVGDVMFMLGANGAGKSSLMHSIFVNNATNTRRITAHRQTWFSSNTVDMTATNKKNTETNISSMDRSPEARWKDDYSAQRSSITVFDLIDAQNIRARSIAHEVDNGAFEKARTLSLIQSPISAINDLMRQSNLDIKLEIQRGEEVTARKGSSNPFSIAQLSDGERNALLIAASVLTAKEGSLILVDEPERHLHRSIISPLLTQLFAKREDCGFVISTHDVGLPTDNPASKTLLVRSCKYSGTVATAWDAEVVPPAGGIDEDIRIEILGSRKRILFVEGTYDSLDQPLYNVVFPGISVIPKKTCKDVEHFVDSIRGSAALHWLSAWGIVDNDSRIEIDRERLKRRGVFPLRDHSVEAIYFHPEMVRRMAAKQADLAGGDPTAIADKAMAAAIGNLRMHMDRLCAKVAHNKVRAEIFKHLPTVASLVARTPINISIDVGRFLQEEIDLFQVAADSADVVWLMGRYPVRETPALDTIARQLGFRDRGVYQSAVRKCLMDDAEALAFVKGLFIDLLNDMDNQSGTTAVNLP